LLLLAPLLAGAPAILAALRGGQAALREDRGLAGGKEEGRAAICAGEVLVSMLFHGLFGLLVRERGIACSGGSGG
jgi:hypothetical protein